MGSTTQKIPYDVVTKREYKQNIFLIGGRKTGKSGLFLRYTRGSFSKAYSPTAGNDLVHFIITQ